MKRSPFPGRYEGLTDGLSHTQVRVRLDAHRFAVEQVISRFEVDRRDGAEWMRLETMGAYIRRASAEIVGRKRTESVSYPATWWEHVKQRWAPRWFLRRWPVRLTTWTVDAFALFPELGPVRAHYLELSFCEPAREVRS